MFSQQSKGLFVDISDFSVLAARTSSFEPPMTVEAVEDVSEVERGEREAYFRDFARSKSGAYVVGRCGAYPENRFVRRHKVESVNKMKDPEFLSQTLRSTYELDPERNMVAVLNARDGSDFDPSQGAARELVFAGAPTESIQAAQDDLLEQGVYPERLEIGTLTTIGGIADFTRFNGIQVPVLCMELTSNQANIFILNEGVLEVARPVGFGLNSIYPLLQKELGLKDQESARKLFFSNTFDFAEIGPKLLQRLVKELQASTGFYEVQTGQTVERLVLGALPKNLAWVERTLADQLGLTLVQPSFAPWMESLDVSVGEGVDLTNFGARWFGLFSLMGQFSRRKETQGEGQR